MGRKQPLRKYGDSSCDVRYELIHHLNLLIVLRIFDLMDTSNNDARMLVLQGVYIVLYLPS